MLCFALIKVIYKIRFCKVDFKSLKIIFNMWPVSSITSSGSGTTPYRPFEPSFDDFRPNPFPSPEPPAPPPTSLSPPLNLNLGGTNWSLSPPADDRDSIDEHDTVRRVDASSLPQCHSVTTTMHCIFNKFCSTHSKDNCLAQNGPQCDRNILKYYLLILKRR